MKTYLNTLLLALILYSCTKENNVPTRNLATDEGCVERVMMPVTAHSINSSDIPLVNSLFQNNGIDNSKYRYFRYTHDSVQTYFPPYAKFDDKVIGVDQYANGLRIFTGDMVYAFKNNIFNFKSDNATSGTSLNTLPQLNTGQVRKLFINDLEQFDHLGAQYKDTCLKAEFGYFNLNAGTGNRQEVLVKAWRVTTKSSIFPSEYPVGYYQDNDGSRIYYDNGIRTIR